MNLEIDSDHHLTTKLNVSNVLRDLATSERSGYLEVVGNKVKWFVFLNSGKLLSINCSVKSLSPLIYRLHQLGHNEAAKEINSTLNSQTYLLNENLIQKEIDRLVVEGKIDLNVGMKMFIEITKETLESLLWLESGVYQWHDQELVVENDEYGLDLIYLIDYYQKRLKVWQNYTAIVRSPHQRPYITNERLLEKPVVAGTLSSTALRQMAQLMRGVSLRELSILLKQDELKVIQMLIPYFHGNIICLREPLSILQQLPLLPEVNLNDSSSSNTPTKTYKIACIDDSPIVLNELERFLAKNKSYSLTKIEDPIKASSLIFRLKPDLILMDITMPHINGYQLCYLFRDSDILRNVPIIIVTGNTGFIDKARAKLVGATDYLTKPFTEAQILELVDKYLTAD